MPANVHSLAVFAVGVSAIVSEDGTGRLPAMGWASWNEYACDINETVFLRVGELLVDLGLKDLGYEYVNIDDCWSDKMKRRDENGRIMPNATMFPRGIKGLTDDIHAMGLKMGIHSDSGKFTLRLSSINLVFSPRLLPEGSFPQSTLFVLTGNSKAQIRG
jgi:alpha-galactosidase